MLSDLTYDQKQEILQYLTLLEDICLTRSRDTKRQTVFRKDYLTTLQTLSDIRRFVEAL